MTLLLMIRHGTTAWNETGRIQGRADAVGLSPVGRRQVASWRLPEPWREARWLVSPLRRARETAAFLTDRALTIEPRLIEMDWGRWEGRRLGDLRAEAAVAMALDEARGLDFRPPGGESPREVCARLASLVEDLVADAAPVVAITHKGVMRAALALATGWDMRHKLPLRPDREPALAFTCHPDSRLELDRAPLCLSAA